MRKLITFIILLISFLNPIGKLHALGDELGSESAENEISEKSDTDAIEKALSVMSWPDDHSNHDDEIKDDNSHGENNQTMNNKSDDDDALDFKNLLSNNDIDNKQSSDNDEKSNQLIENVGINNLRKMPYAEIIVLNKITTKYENIKLKVGEVKYFGNLSIELNKCVNDPSPQRPNNYLLLSIFDNKIDDDKISIFHGWMISNNHSISTLEHPVYEVIPVSCLPWL